MADDGVRLTASAREAAARPAKPAIDGPASAPASSARKLADITECPQ
jgi:hypothetical protein